MKAADMFPGKYLRADDLKGAEPIVTIREVRVETVGDDSKPVLFFAGKDKGLVMNKTNWAAIVDITNEDDSDNWAGHKVKLVTRKVDYQGKRVPAIRIEEPSAVKAKPEPVEHIDDSEVPF
jgi:predicted hydrocarbon binding protein